MVQRAACHSARVAGGRAGALLAMMVQPYTNESVCVSPNGGVVQRVLRDVICPHVPLFTGGLTTTPLEDLFAMNGDDRSVEKCVRLSTVSFEVGQTDLGTSSRLSDLQERRWFRILPPELRRLANGGEGYLVYGMGQAESVSETVCRRHQQS